MRGKPTLAVIKTTLQAFDYFKRISNRGETPQLKKNAADE